MKKYIVLDLIYSFSWRHEYFNKEDAEAAISFLTSLTRKHSIPRIREEFEIIEIDK